MSTVQTNLEKQLEDLERDYWQAIKDQNVQETLRLTDNPCIVAGAQGVASVDHATFEKMAKESTWKLLDFELDDVKVRFLTDDVAIIAYKVREDMLVEGKEVTLNAADSSTWVKRHGRWLCALHTESAAGDPFGRDKNHHDQKKS